MPVHSGARLGPYEILSAVGAGGMGEVYRARDTRLGRDVAIKVLPAAFAEDADRVARFEREARAVAALSHPNVVAIFDTGVDAGRAFVVMELLAGQTLRERLTPPVAIPPRKAVEIAAQIARGLGAAHGKGIVHRDLKPENIYLLDDGQVKILDFGLARQSEERPADATRTVIPGTDPGTVMGTVGYMAPEQVRGLTVDPRADVFSFGAVLYEMLSGTRAFDAATPADTLTAILTADPPELTGSRPELTPALDRIIRHCLEKNPGERFQNARDVAFALETLSGTTPSAVQPAVVPPARRRWIAPALMIAIGAGGLAAGVDLERRRHGDPEPIAFETKTWDPQWITNARFGPDGQTIVFSAAPSGSVPSLFLIPPGAITPQRIGEPGTHLLSVSSKGELAVITGATSMHHRIFSGTLSRMTMDGAARPWLEDVAEADYSPDGSSLAIIRKADTRWQLEYPVGTVLYTAPTGYVSDPRVSPDGTRVAFLDHRTSGDDRGSLKVVETSGRVSALSAEYWGVEGVAWSADSRTVFFVAASASSQFNLSAVTIGGTPQVRQILPSANYAFVTDVAKDGRMLFAQGELRLMLRALVPGQSDERDLSWMGFSILPFLSPDGRRLLFEDLSEGAGADYAVAVRDLVTDKVVRLGPGTSLGLSPDGRWVGAHIPSTQKLVLYPTGAGEPVTLSRERIDIFMTRLQWFSRGTRVLYCGREPSSPFRCYAQGIQGDAATVVTPDDVTDAVMAGDERTLAIRRTSGEWQTMTIGSTETTAVKGLNARDEVLAWTADGRGLILAAAGSVPVPIDRLDMATGKRLTLKELAPPDRAGVVLMRDFQWLPDGRGYAYGYQRESTRLLVVRGGRR